MRLMVERAKIYKHLYLLKCSLRSVKNLRPAFVALII